MNLKILFALLLMLGFVSCSDDDTNISFNNPTVTPPSGVSNINVGMSGSLDFTVSIDSELTATYVATGFGVNITNTSGNVSGNTITINYEAGNSAGAASIELTINDSDGQSSTGTAVLNVVDENMSLITSNITADETWTADKTYVLGGRISVEDGASLTIEPGTIIKGEAGTGPNATALLIARGAKLMAEGTASLPIIFTSVADEITSEQIATGDFTSPNLDPDINGLWGGLIVLGKATISASNNNNEDLNEVQIEGIPTSDPNGLYGGNEDNDNSGVMTYISIRHGGSNIGDGNEINGLTLGGVGSGTVIENVEIVANQDDGIEWFGGTVSVRNALVWNAGDDAIDTDQSWSGTLDNFVVVTPSGSCFELDGPEGTFIARHTITNGTVVAISGDRTTGGSLIDVDSSTPVDMSNIHFVGPLQSNGTWLTLTDDEVENSSFMNVTFDVDAANLENLMEQGGSVPNGISTGSTHQANVSELSWTWAAQAGGLDGL